MNFLELVKARYSARKYAGRSVEIEKLEYIMAVSYTHLTLPTIA